jgi:hypothetical protein
MESLQKPSQPLLNKGSAGSKVRTLLPGDMHGTRPELMVSGAGWVCPRNPGIPISATARPSPPEL